MIDIEKSGQEDIFKSIIQSLTEQSKIEILYNRDFIIKKLNLRNDFYIAGCISTIKSEEAKIKIILENRYQLDKDSLISLMSELDNELLFDLIANHKGVLKENNIRSI